MDDWWLDYVAKPYEIFERLPRIVRVREMLAWHRKRPLIAKAFTVKVEMGRPDFFSVRVTMWRAAKIQPGKDHHLPSAVLIGALCQIDPSPSQVEKERFAPVNRDQRNRDLFSEVRIIPFSRVNPTFLQCH